MYVVGVAGPPDLLLSPGGDRTTDADLGQGLSRSCTPQHATETYTPQRYATCPASCVPRPVELVELGAGTPPGRVGKPFGVGRGFHA
jgi:hypothetical protein